MKTKSVSTEPKGNAINTLLPPVFNFSGWHDIDCERPKENKDYLCVVKYENDNTYHYLVIENIPGIGFIIPFDTIDLLLWTDIPPHPFS